MAPWDTTTSNWDLFDGPRTHLLRPEGRVHAPTASGELRLVAVERVVPKSIWDESGSAGDPIGAGDRPPHPQPGLEPVHPPRLGVAIQPGRGVRRLESRDLLPQATDQPRHGDRRRSPPPSTHHRPRRSMRPATGTTMQQSVPGLSWRRGIRAWCVAACRCSPGTPPTLARRTRAPRRASRSSLGPLEKRHQLVSRHPDEPTEPHRPQLTAADERPYRVRMDAEHVGGGGHIEHRGEVGVGARFVHHLARNQLVQQCGVCESCASSRNAFASFPAEHRGWRHRGSRHRRLSRAASRLGALFGGQRPRPHGGSATGRAQSKASSGAYALTFSGLMHDRGRRWLRRAFPHCYGERME